MASLENKKILVVGGSSGMGLATANAAAEAGGLVTIASRSADKLAAAASVIGRGVETRQLDAGDDFSVATVFGPGELWDHVAISAGSGGRGRLPEIPMADAMAAMNAKFWAYYRVARAVKIVPGGSLTFVSGQLGQKSSPSAALISAINAAIEGLTRGLALDLAPTRVNTVSPGLVETPMWDRLPTPARQAMYDAAAARLPAGRIGQPEDVAQAILFMMTNNFATGSILNIDGGSAGSGPH